MSYEPKIIVALDFSKEEEVYLLLEKLEPGYCKLKVGKELFTRFGPKLVKRLVDDGFDVFLDLKFHDIPNTVAKACAAAAELGVWMINVHAQGGTAMLEAARKALQDNNSPLLIAVTVLTSLSDKELQQMCLNLSAQEYANQLAALANNAGLDGVVCSAHETQQMKSRFGSGFKLVTPGIRPAGYKQDDQKRVVTPLDAIKLGSDYLVIGRPITHSADPVGQILTINSEICSIS